MIIINLQSTSTQIAIGLPNEGGPILLHLGPPFAGLGEPVPWPVLPASPDDPTWPCLFPVHGFGDLGEPAIAGIHNGHRSDFSLQYKEYQQDGHQIITTYRDPVARIDVYFHFSLCPKTDLLEGSCRVTNWGTHSLLLHHLCPFILPLPAWVSHVDAPYGRWAHEGHIERLALGVGNWSQSVRGGKPGFTGGPFITVCEAYTDEISGKAIGAALSHSGSFQTLIEALPDGHKQLCLREAWQPGEVNLAPDENIATPSLLIGISNHGTNALSKQFHRYVRKQTRHYSNRPVHFNSWEAVYFSVTETVAKELADEAAALGAERFVLDDGWFKGRHGDQTSLGDWTPDPEKFLNGLTPLIDHVKNLGMQFGLWVEPEMINPESDLYKAHPDWVLHAPERPRPTGRNQLVLDLTQDEVFDYTFDWLDRLLSDHDISYLKWDHNRDLYPAASKGIPAGVRQVRALYQLLDRIKEHHPRVEIESCASGGGRIDYGILPHIDRFWASDATDPVERLRINRQNTLFFPSQLMGSHVGPTPNPITGRLTPMAFRCMASIFSHFGLELDPRQLSTLDRDILKRAIAFYKQERTFIAEGQLYRLPYDNDPVEGQLVLNEDKSRGLLRLLRVDSPTVASLSFFTCPYLQPESSYQVEEISFEIDSPPSGGFTMSGAQLGNHGADLRPSRPLSGRLFCLTTQKG